MTDGPEPVKLHTGCDNRPGNGGQIGDGHVSIEADDLAEAVNGARTASQLDLILDLILKDVFH